MALTSLGRGAGCAAADSARFRASTADFTSHGNTGNSEITPFQAYPRGVSVRILSLHLTQ